MTNKDAYVQKMEAQIKQFGAKFDHLKAQAQEKIADGRIKVNDAISNAKGAAHDKMADTKSVTHDKVADAKSMVDDKINQGKAKGEELSARAKAEYESLVAKFNQIKAAGDNDWEALKSTFEKGWNDFTQSASKKSGYPS